MRVSSGCIRMYPEGIAALFPRVPVGAPVRIIDRPWAVGRENGVPHVQVFARPRLEAGVEWPDSLLDHTPLVRALLERVPRGAVDWDGVMKATEERLGVPLPVAPKSPSLEMLLERVEEK
jgi:L,D-transpeptidase ErfK/SrfK